MDIGGGVDAWLDNNRWGVNNQSFSQDPIYDVQVKLSYDFTKSAYFGLEYRFATGGKADVDGCETLSNNDTQELKFTSGFWFGVYQLQAGYNMTLDSKNSVKVNTYQFRFLYIF